MFYVFIENITTIGAGYFMIEWNGQTILLIERNLIIRRIFYLIFRRHGYEVLIAKSACDGMLVEVCFPTAIDILFSGPVGCDLVGTMSERRPEMDVMLMGSYNHAASLFLNYGRYLVQKQCLALVGRSNNDMPRCFPPRVWKVVMHFSSRTNPGRRINGSEDRTRVTSAFQIR
jgi:hypothetical protein